jgi:hypothetical protein
MNGDGQQVADEVDVGSVCLRYSPHEPPREATRLAAACWAATAIAVGLTILCCRLLRMGLVTRCYLCHRFTTIDS